MERKNLFLSRVSFEWNKFQNFQKIFPHKNTLSGNRCVSHSVGKPGKSFTQQYLIENQGRDMDAFPEE